MTTHPPEKPPEDPPQDAAGAGDLTGRVINNNYRVIRLIGRGGMGEVYEGEHLFTGNRIAIKMVLQSLSRDPQILALFKREARTLFQLTDDSIARYLDSVHDPLLDRYCLIMDFIEGVHLSDHVAQQGPLTVSQARQLALRLAGGLGRAHQLGIVHRDLSPDNVMLRAGDVGQAVLIDFGIARSEGGGEATLHGQLAGKFKYISPEQLGHFDAAIGPRTDIYGLGLILAMALRGTPIDMGNSVVAAVEARRVVPPLDGVPPEMVPLLSRMLEPDPARRPASMAELAALISAPVVAPAPMDHDRTILIRQPHLTQPEGQAQRTMIAGPGLLTAPPAGMAVPGAPGMTAPPVSWPAPALQDHSGGFQGLPTPPPVTAPPGTFPAAAGRERRTRLPLMIGLGLAVLLATGGGWWALQGAAPAPVPPDTTAPGPSAETAAPDPGPGLPPPDRTTREGLLAADLPPAACAYATRITAGGNSGRIEVFGTAPEDSAAISGLYAEAFGSAPGLVMREVAKAQCAALDLVRGLQGRNGIAPQITLDGDSMASGGSLIGRVSETRGRAVWLFLVSASGAVHDLSSRLESQADGSWLFVIGARSLSGRAEPQLLVVIASETPLVSAAAAPAGAAASVLLPAVLAEIARREDKAAAQIAWFMLTP